MTEIDFNFNCQSFTAFVHTGMTKISKKRFTPGSKAAESCWQPPGMPRFLLTSIFSNDQELKVHCDQSQAFNYQKAI
jgi:hypothetical protein